MKKLCKQIAFIGAFFLISMNVNFQAQAGCFGTNSFYTCNDSSGNSYNVSKFGNSTTVYGSNSRTGSSWSSTTNKIGNNSYTYGRDKNGNSWSTTTTPFGSWGTDSNGNSWSR